MSNTRKRKVIGGVLLALLALAALVLGLAKDRPPAPRPPAVPPHTARICIIKFDDHDADGMRDPGEPLLPGMSYRLEGAFNPYKYVQVDISGGGEAVLEYELLFRPAGQPKTERIEFQVEPELIEKLLQAYLKVDFFNIVFVDLNKDRITVTDVGTTYLSLRYAGQERKIRYGYIEDNPFEEILRLYWELIKPHLSVRW